MDLQQTIREMILCMADDAGMLHAHSLLEVIGRPAVPALVAALTTPPAGVDPHRAQFGAAMILGHLRAPEAVGPLRGLVLTGSVSVRQFAVDALGQIGDHSAVPELIQASADPDKITQLGAIGALRALGDARAEATLLKLAEDPGDPNVRYAAVRALTTSGTQAAAGVLQRLLAAEPNENVRFEIQKTINALNAK